MRKTWVLIVFPILLIGVVVGIFMYYNNVYKFQQMDEKIDKTNQIYLENLPLEKVDEFINSSVIPSPRFIEKFQLNCSLRSIFNEKRSNTISADEVTERLGKVFGSGITFTHQSVVGYDFNASNMQYTRNSKKLPEYTTIKLKTVENSDGTYDIYIANIFITKNSNLNMSANFISTMVVSNDPFGKEVIYTEPFEGEPTLENSIEQAKKIENDIENYKDKLLVLKYTFSRDGKIEAIEYSELP